MLLLKRQILEEEERGSVHRLVGAHLVLQLDGVDRETAHHGFHLP